MGGEAMAMTKRLGHYSFLGGVLLAVVLGLFSAKISGPTTSILLLVLVILGVIVGFLNVTGKEMTEFLIAAIALIAMSSVSATLVVIDQYIPNLGTLFQSILSFIAIFVAPAALVVALKTIVELAEKE